MIFGARASNFIRPLLAMPSVQQWLKTRIERSVKGPGESLRSKQPTFVWGEARNARGEVKTARVRTDNVYSLTITGALAVVDHLANHPPTGGAYTPARLVGPHLVTSLPGSGPMQVS